MTLRFPLRGPRLDLRPFTADDAAAAHRVYGDPEVMRFVGDGDPASPLRTPQMLSDYAAHQARHGFAFWAVIERASGELIGDAGLEVTDQGVELGFTLGRRWWGRGLATEAARLCVRAACGPLGLPHLVALVDVDNPASARVLEKLGFVGDGIVSAYGRAHHRFQLCTDRPVTMGTSPV